MRKITSQRKRLNSAYSHICGSRSGSDWSWPWGRIHNFWRSQPDPSDEIEAIIEKKMAEADAERLAEEEAALSNEKVVKETPDIETFVTTYFEFPGNFTTNLRASRKFLQVGLGVSTQYDDEVITNVEDHQLALRSEILNVMSEFSEEDIQGKEGREAQPALLQMVLMQS